MSLAVFAVVAISFVGILLSQQSVADADGPAPWVEMEANYRNYDWGDSKPNGDDPENKIGYEEYSEYKHRSILEDEFKVQTLQTGNRLDIKINVPRPWSFSRKAIFVTLDYTVEYEIEKAYHRTVARPSDCRPISAQTNTPIPSVVGSLEKVQSVITLSDAEVAENTTLYSCVIVKLKGDITGGGWLPDPDTHPEWAFVSPEPITQTVAWPDISVVSDGETITAQSLAGASGLRFYFKHRTLIEGAQCDESAFAVAPNHPGVHYSNQFNIPDSPSPATRAYYDNRYICFQATIINIDNDAYAPGASVYRYRDVRIEFPSKPRTPTYKWPAEEQPARRQVRGEAVTVGEGIFTGGVHVKVGLYDVTFVAGEIGNFIIYREDGSLKVIDGPSSDHGSDKIRVEIAANSRIEIISLSSVTFTPVDSAFVTEYRTISLYAGTFIVGEDIGAGKYTATPGAGEGGNFRIYDVNDIRGSRGKVNVILGSTSRFGIPTVTANLNNGDIIYIKGMNEVRFTPSN